MKITAIPQLYRNLRRWREILAVLRRYGLADWLSRHRSLPFRDRYTDRGGVPLAEYSREQRIRIALTELGPTFIKLGQILSARPDLVGPELAQELKRLRAHVRPDSIARVESTLAAELGADYRKHFRSIESVPLATASIGQVHRATLHDDRRVVIKVQRSGIESVVRKDIEVLAGVAQLAERVDAFSAWGPTEMIRQMSKMITYELDFGRERQNLEHFADLLGGLSDEIAIPKPIEALCTRRVLVMEELVGRSLADIVSESPAVPATPSQIDGRGGEASGGENNRIDSSSPESSLPDSLSSSSVGEVIRPELCESIARAYLTMLFQSGSFHADPHPGNLILLRDGRLGILDFGMVGRIDETLRETIEGMLMAIAAGDQNRLTRLIRRAGDCPPTLDESALAVDVAEFIGTYGKQSFGQFDLSGALNQLSDVLHRHAIKLPNQSALLLKMLVSLEGTLREAGARFDSLDVVQSFVKKSMLERFSPRRRLRQARRIYLEAENLLESAPDEVLSLLRQARRGEVTVALEHRRIGPTVNRLVLGMMASAVFLGSSLLLAFEVKPVLFAQSEFMGIRDLSVLGIVGVAGSFAVMLWLLIAINRSGHLTRENED